MPKKTVIITGDKKVNRMLKRLAATEGKAAVRKAARPALKPVQKEAKGNAPRGKTGDLKRSVKVRALARSRRFVGARVTSALPKGATEGTYYGGFQDLGTEKIDATKWMRDAANSKRKAALTIYRRLLRTEIIQRARKAAK